MFALLASSVSSGLGVVLLAATLFVVPCSGQQVVLPLEQRHVLPDETLVDAPQHSIVSVASAVLLPSGFYVEEIVPGNSFSTPVAVAFAPDGRIFVVEKRGRIYIVQNGVKLSTPFINIESEVLNHWDRGLLGFTLDPDFENNGYVYLLYTFDWDGSGDTAREDVAARLTRFTVDDGNPNVVDPASRLVLIGDSFDEGIPSCYYSHTIGTIRFGSDGTLLVGAGDGAHFGQIDAGGLQPSCFGDGKFSSDQDVGAFRSQYLGSLAGKILRIDPATGLGLASNPFFTGNAADAQSRVWALGLRNPYRFTLRDDGSTNPDDGEPGTLFVGDVGWGTWEDLHVAHGGENFGWPCYEGPNQHAGYQAQTPVHSDCSALTVQSAPQYYWHHSNSALSSPAGMLANAIVVGDIYTGYRYPAQYNGRIFYADYTRGWISTSHVDVSNNLSDHQQFASGAGAVVDVRFDDVSNYVYYVDVSAGKVFRLRHNDENAPPVAIATSDVVDGYAPLGVQFTGSQSFDPDADPITFLWDFGDGDTSSAIDPFHTFTTSGVFDVVLTVTDPSGAEHQAYLQIAVNNTYPTSHIDSPQNGQSFRLGETVSLVGSGADAEDPSGALSFEWRVLQQHNTHAHPDFFADTGSVAGFEIEQHGVDSEVSFLRIQLIVTDTGGLSDTTEHVIEVERRGEHDITNDGTPIALVTSPTGSGNTDIGVIADGVVPAVGSADPLLHYDTYDGASKSLDWIGYAFPSARYLSKLVLTQGVQAAGGGWFETLGVQARVDGVWLDVSYLSILRPYEGDNGVNFDSYTLLFEGVVADGVRVIGEPGGTADYISVSELRVFELAGVDFSANVVGGTQPLHVTLTDESSIAGAWTWTWDFGDGSSSTGATVQHTYQEPGAFDVTLSITSPDGVFVSTKTAFVVVGPNGLLGQYFDNIDFSGARILRDDPNVDFSWGVGAPDPAIGPDQFSVRWTGWVRAEYSETYTFHTITDDGVRLWVNGQSIVDQWIPQAATEWTGTIALEENQYYAVMMEYFEDGGAAVARLDWSSASRPRQTIPVTSLRAGFVAPRVSGFDPPTGDYLDTVHIFGENLSSVTAVLFGGHATNTIGVVSDGHIWAHVPPSAVSGPLSVSSPDGTAVSLQAFGVNDGTLPIELEAFQALVVEAGVRLNWRLGSASDIAGIAVEHGNSDEPGFSELVYIDARPELQDYELQTGIVSAGHHRFRLRLVDTQGVSTYSGSVELQINTTDDVVVSPPYPNPFAHSASIEFTVARTQQVEVSMYDMLGRRLRVLFSGEVVDNVPIRVAIEAMEAIPSGMYLLRIRGDYFVVDRKITRVGR